MDGEVVGYKVYRSGSSDGEYVWLGSGELYTTGATSYVDTGVVRGVRYYYKVQAVTGMGLESKLSGYVYGSALSDEVGPGVPRDVVTLIVAVAAWR